MRVPAQSKSAARQRYKSFLQESLNCVSANAIFMAQETAPDEYVLLHRPDDVLRLKRQQPADPLWLKVTQHFHYEKDDRYPGEWKVKTDGYAYTVSESEDLSSELFAWHWHPTTSPDPHLHLGRAHPLYQLVGRAHLPTGRVALEQIIALLVRDLGVEPCRTDYEAVLADKLKRFREFRRWG